MSNQAVHQAHHTLSQCQDTLIIKLYSSQYSHVCIFIYISTLINIRLKKNARPTEQISELEQEY